jgi:hypothetical protein
MAVATIKLVNGELLGQFFFNEDTGDLARKLIREGCYEVQGSMGFADLEGEAVAEEVFDLTNNPCRQDEREELYGRFRSVSVGDIVNVDGVDYLCCSVGWRVI